MVRHQVGIGRPGEEKAEAERFLHSAGAEYRFPKPAERSDRETHLETAEVFQTGHLYSAGSDDPRFGIQSGAQPAVDDDMVPPCGHPGGRASYRLQHLSQIPAFPKAKTSRRIGGSPAAVIPVKIYLPERAESE